MSCSLVKHHETLSLLYADRVVEAIKAKKKKKPVLVWLETSGCFGEAVSLLNAEDPDLMYVLTEMVEIKYFASFMAEMGEVAINEIIEATQDDSLILVVDGAIPVGEYEDCASIGLYDGKRVSAYEGVLAVAKYAKHIIAVGTCACYGGPTSAAPNPSNSKSVPDVLSDYNVIKVPGCPAHPCWITGTLSALMYFENLELDEDNRPKLFFSDTIHDYCERRSFFDNEQFATKLSDKECMFTLGCKGPFTKAPCAKIRWNTTSSWPIGANTTCLGCASASFPDNTPYISFD